jgi:adenine-specific DNA-methyltransferase
MRYSFPRYETNQLVSLLGGKRALQEPLRLIFEELMPKRGLALFVDPFSGSGAVTRIARSLGCKVAAGDLEPFAFILNHVYLTLDSSDLAPLFREMGGLDAYLSLLNLQGLYAATNGLDLPQGYLSRYYAPHEDARYDGERERLYYTRFNALFLDAVREEIEQSWLSGRITAVEKAIVLSCILYEASRRANTSGSFTAYLKKFGSYEETALSRITGQSELSAPMLPEEGAVKGSMYIEEASNLVKRFKADICFLDPPSSIHQYGSAYHMLNSITVWDHLAPSDERDAQGCLVDRSGIRSDWKQTHSPFCSLKHADAAMIHLLGCVDARHIVLTYPSSGIISAQRIYELLSAHSQPVRVIPLPKRNQGGRQPLNGVKKTVEQVFITGKSASTMLMVEDSMEKLRYIAQLHDLISAVFHPAKRQGPLTYTGGVLLEELPPAHELLAYEAVTLATLVREALALRCDTLEESLDVMVEALDGRNQFPVDGKGRVRIEKRILSILRRGCDTSHRQSFDSLYMRVCAQVQGKPSMLSLGRHLDALGEAANQRIGDCFH